MRIRSLLALLAFASFAAAVVVGMGASAAFAGESTGNCGAGQPVDPFTGSATAAANCKGPLAAPGTRVSNGNSWCSYSGQNDYPDGSQSGPGGRTQNYGQDVKSGLASSPGFPQPGTACNPANPNNFGGGSPPPRKQAGP
jgi:hypothetical protein